MAILLAKTPIKPETLFTGDSSVITVRAEKDGKLRVTCGSWDAYKAIHPGEVIEIRWSLGQVQVLRKDKRR